MSTKKHIVFISLIIIMNSCQLNWFGDIDLGSSFYYIVEPAFNSIVIPVNKNKPYDSSIYVIKGIESIGYNKEFILVSSMDNDTLKYWKIYKTAETKQLGYNKNSAMRLSNLTEINFKEFVTTVNSENITLKTKSQYRKEHNYE